MWEQIRVRGRKNFVLTGMFQRGFRSTGPLALIFLVIIFFTHHLTDISSQLVILTSFAVLTVLIGLGDGLEQWSRNELKYKRFYKK